MTLDQPGPIPGGASMRFNGSSYISLGTNASLHPPGDWTVETWFRASPNDASACASTIGGQCILFQVHSYGMHLLLEPNGALQGVFLPTTCACSQPTPGGAYDLISPGTYDDNAWHQAVLVRDTSEFLLYVDGVAVASEPVTETTTVYGGADGGLGAIGADPYYQDGFLTGWESEVAFYNDALSPAQVAAHTLRPAKPGRVRVRR